MSFLDIKNPEERDTVIADYIALKNRLKKRDNPMRLVSFAQFAQAMINKPDILIADEPTGNVDPDMARRIFRLFIELNRRLNTTIIIATHDMHIIREFKSPVLKLQDGLLFADSSYEQA